MIKYLICQNKARAMGISREVYVAFVECMGTEYKTENQPVDAYGFQEHPSDGRAILVVDTESTYYIGLPDVHKSRLVEIDKVIAEGFVI